MLARRSFLKALPATPFAAKKAAENAAASISRIGAGPSLGLGLGVAQESTTAVSLGNIPTDKDWIKLVGDVAFRKELESIYYERERSVSSIDPDIAVYRSFSLSAKIAYQRERNVARQVAALTDGNGWWGRFEKFRRKAMGF